jgi:flagellin
MVMHMAFGIGATSSTSSLFAQNALRINNLLFQRTAAQLSSGNRLISGAIDPSGLAISMQMRSQIGGTDQAIYNTQDNINLTRTADAQLGTQGEILGRMRDLAVRAGNDATLTASDRTRLDNEYQSLATELNRQGRSNSFNTKQLTTDVAGSQYGTQSAQIGPNSGDNTGVTINPSTADSMGITAAGSGQNLLTGASARDAIDRIDTAIEQVSTQRASLGVQERNFQYITNDLSAQRINMTEANSRIADTDFAAAISEQTKAILLGQVSIAALSQSNAQGFGVLSLLGA